MSPDRSVPGTPTVIQRSSPVPLYYQLSRAIRDDIASGRLERGAELASEGELCRIYGVSRVTVRQAVADLLGEGILVRQRPRGPLVVNGPRIPREILETSGPFVDDILAGGIRRQTRLLRAERESAAPRTAAQLEIAVGDVVYRIERLHLGDQEPLARQISWLPAAMLPGLLDHDLSRSLQSLYEDRYGYFFERKVQRIGARAATDEEASALGLGRRSPIIELERLVILPDGRRVEFLSYALRPDRLVIVSELGRPSRPAARVAAPNRGGVAASSHDHD